MHKLRKWHRNVKFKVLHIRIKHNVLVHNEFASMLNAKNDSLFILFTARESAVIAFTLTRLLLRALSFSPSHINHLPFEIIHSYAGDTRYLILFICLVCIHNNDDQITFVMCSKQKHSIECRYTQFRV